MSPDLSTLCEFDCIPNAILVLCRLQFSSIGTRRCRNPTNGFVCDATPQQGFFTFNLAIYSYFGQAFMCLVPHMATAQILCSVFIGLNNFFSGLIVRPQFMTGIFAFTYWITPGHYVYEGMIVAQYWNDKRTVIANPGSEFYEWLGCGEDDDSECTGDVEQYLWVFFGGKFNSGNIPMDVLVLALFLVLARVCTYFAIRYFNYTST